jgi:hypothetical protein
MAASQRGCIKYFFCLSFCRSLLEWLPVLCCWMRRLKRPKLPKPGLPSRLRRLRCMPQKSSALAAPRKLQAPLRLKAEETDLLGQNAKHPLLLRPARGRLRSASSPVAVATWAHTARHMLPKYPTHLLLYSSTVQYRTVGTIHAPVAIVLHCSTYSTVQYHTVLYCTVQVSLTHKSSQTKNLCPPWYGGQNEKDDAIRRISSRPTNVRRIF